MTYLPPLDCPRCGVGLPDGERECPRCRLDIPAEVIAACL